MAFNSTGDYYDAIVSEGRVWHSYYYKAFGGIGPHPRLSFIDLSMEVGYPSAQIYPGNAYTATELNYRSQGAIDIGSNVAPYTKQLSVVFHHEGVNAFYGIKTLVDCPMYYPDISTNSAGTFAFLNPISLPRYYANAKGVRATMVALTDLGGEAANAYIVYTNESGVSGRVSGVLGIVPWTKAKELVFTPVATSFAQITAFPFFPLQEGDNGVRSVEYLVLDNRIGPGYCALVLMKQVVSMGSFSGTAPFLPTEQNYFGRNVNIPDGAFLNLIINSGSSNNSGICGGFFEFVWG